MPTDTHDMIVVHRVFRREFRLAPGLTRAVRPGDAARAGVVGAHLADLHLGLHHHHTNEDVVLWPLLLARVDLEAERVLLMEAQHQEIDALLQKANDLLPEWMSAAAADARDELAGVYDRLLPVLVAHLAAEEDEILPLVAEHISQDEWDEMGKRFTVDTPKDKLMLFLGALLEEATPDERAHMLGNLPAPARLAWRLIGRRSYEKRVRGLRGSAGPR
jgi:iron-sulfur cluster repair protein YtfE (RIC family)